jgi:hypothetical protein
VEGDVRQIVIEFARAAWDSGAWWLALLVLLAFAVALVKGPAAVRALGAWVKRNSDPVPSKHDDVNGPEIPPATFEPNTDLDDRPPG